MGYQATALAILAVFYGVYFSKMAAQKKKGIQTNQMTRGNKAANVVVTERLLSLITVLVPVAEMVSILLGTAPFPASVRIAGLTVGALGAAVFTAAVWAMRDSWRAGIPAQDQTELVTGGLFRYSRNPAFLGFDLVYIGVLLSFFNWALLVCSLFAITMLHLQILQEETFLSKIFGQAYENYKAQVARYLGRR